MEIQTVLTPLIKLAASFYISILGKIPPMFLDIKLTASGMAFHLYYPRDLKTCIWLLIVFTHTFISICGAVFILIKKLLYPAEVDLKIVQICCTIFLLIMEYTIVASVGCAYQDGSCYYYLNKWINNDIFFRMSLVLSFVTIN